MHEIEIEGWGGSATGKHQVKDQHCRPFIFIYCTETNLPLETEKKKERKFCIVIEQPFQPLNDPTLKDS